MKRRAVFLSLSLILVFSTICFSNAAASHNMELEYQWNLAVYSSKSTDEAAYLEQLQPSPMIQSDDPGIVTLAHSIVKDISSNYEKAKAIYTWVANNIWYDWDCFDSRTVRGNGSALETLQNRSGICLGYSNLTVALLRAADIPAFVAAGHILRGSGSEGDFPGLSESFRNADHVWNEAYVDGRWIIMDTTWASNNYIRYGVHSKQQSSSNAYFDMPLRELSKTHRYSLNYSFAPYPVVAYAVPHGVISIADYAFWRNESLMSITLPGSIGFIGNAAFGYCTSLKDVVIPGSVASIGDFAFFRSTSLESITISDGVAEIGYGAFSGCTSLESIYIPNSVTSIGNYAFHNAHNVTIKGSAGSYAQAYAVLNSIPFEVASHYSI
jgi:hypothetical protein